MTRRTRRAAGRCLPPARARAAGPGPAGASAIERDHRAHAVPAPAGVHPAQDPRTAPGRGRAADGYRPEGGGTPPAPGHGRLPPAGRAAMRRTPGPPTRPQPSQPPSTDELLDQHRDALKERFPLPDPKTLQRRRGGRAAKVVLPALALMAGALLLVDPAWQVQDHRTAAGERRALELADGSHLLLDAGTHLQVRRHLRSRQVVLIQGRARFQVQHLAWRRFEVDAGPVRVRNYGTVFDVDRQGDLSEVTLWRGEVGVRAEGSDAEQRLEPGQRLLAQPG
ncbi:hypothetical protein G6F50_013508 [Rhizopus delemar]|uniref:FecR protein domain-containing protein n=1 Tax=Rhizopus delemar TaxID=936053 RepID=A0A9P6YGX9_9FUNG|nr:hypothetical protein G6F50_013508 [Rhizopus delemar]